MSSEISYFQNQPREKLIEIIWDLSWIIGIQYSLCERSKYNFSREEKRLFNKCEKRIDEIFYGQ